LRRGEGYQNVPEEFGFVEIEKKKYIVGTVCENVCIFIFICGVTVVTMVMNFQTL
jgi:hypothetical protein